MRPRLEASLALALLAWLPVLGAACGGEALPKGAVQPPVDAAGPPPAASVDPLGERPALLAPTPFVPPVPTAYARPNGARVWLLERHTLPIVSIQVVVPAGAARDPEGKGGLAAVTADMLDEGAGARGALDISREIDRLGATLQTGAYADYAFVELTTLTKNLSASAAILGDVVTKPAFSVAEWRRVHDLWENELRARMSEPEAVASVVAQRMVFGDEPYGHPTRGTLKSAAKVSLDDVKRFHASAWRPEEAAVIVVGDVTRAELDPLLEQVLGGWRAGPRAPAAPASPAAAAAPQGRKVVVVDRPDAPQSVIALARRGVAASDPVALELVRVNTALGGSFTSRLNQDLREEHGWSYGARSRFSFQKAPGIFTAQAAVQTDHTGDALQAMLKDAESLARSGLTEEELEKTRLIARSELVESFQSVQAAGRRLARNAAVGLAPDHEPKASLVVDRATPEALKRAAGAYVDPSSAVIVIVGPRAKLQPQLDAIGLKAVQAVGPEGE